MICPEIPCGGATNGGLGSEIQNNNDSLNSLLCDIAPKQIHSGAKIIESVTFIAVWIFNEGFISILKIMTLIEIKIDLEA